MPVEVVVDIPDEILDALVIVMPFEVGFSLLQELVRVSRRWLASWSRVTPPPPGVSVGPYGRVGSMKPPVVVRVRRASLRVAYQLETHFCRGGPEMQESVNRTTAAWRGHGYRCSPNTPQREATIPAGRGPGGRGQPRPLTDLILVDYRDHKPDAISLYKERQRLIAEGYSAVTSEVHRQVYGYPYRIEYRGVK